jgi:hypothetical protein
MGIFLLYEAASAVCLLANSGKTVSGGAVVVAFPAGVSNATPTSSDGLQVHADPGSTAAPSGDNASALAAKLQNPIADLISVPF